MSWMEKKTDQVKTPRWAPPSNPLKRALNTPEHLTTNNNTEPPQKKQRTSEGEYYTQVQPTQQQRIQQQIMAQLPTCSCGKFDTVVKKTSQSEKNPGRDFFSCHECSSFMWCDTWDGDSPLPPKKDGNNNNNTKKQPYNKSFTKKPFYNSNSNSSDNSEVLAELKITLENILLMQHTQEVNMHDSFLDIQKDVAQIKSYLGINNDLPESSSSSTTTTTQHQPEEHIHYE